MAESMFDTYANGRMEVTHNGDSIFFELPKWMKEVGPIIEDKEKLLAWSAKHDNLLAIYHAAFAKIKIDFCAVVRPADVAGEKKGEKVKVSLVKDKDNAQKRGLEFNIKPATRPGTGGGVKTKAEIDTLTKVCQAMRDNGIDDHTIHKMQDPVFGKAKVALALNNIEEI
jgi:hypothetical protein